MKMKIWRGKKMNFEINLNEVQIKSASGLSVMSNKYTRQNLLDMFLAYTSYLVNFFPLVNAKKA